MVSVPFTDLNQKDWQEILMIFSFMITPDQRASVIVPVEVIDRLQRTCFRGVNVRCAGNFFRWPRADLLLWDARIQSHIEKTMLDCWARRRFGNASITIGHEKPIGWESTNTRSSYPRKALGPFTPNRKSHALRVMSSKYVAPKTSLVTIVFEFKLEHEEPIMVIRSIYPGIDIGPLAGDITHRTGRVFFDWNHPGAP